jgi:hypothetical protein
MVAYDQSFLNANVKQLPTTIYTVKMASAGWNVSLSADLFILKTYVEIK